MSGRKAAALACTLLAWGLRLCAIGHIALTIALSFSGMATRLGIVNLVLDIAQVLPAVIAGWGLVATPFGGVFRLDFVIVALVLFLADYVLLRIADALRH